MLLEIRSIPLGVRNRGYLIYTVRPRAALEV